MAGDSAGPPGGKGWDEQAGDDYRGRDERSGRGCGVGVAGVGDGDECGDGGCVTGGGGGGETGGAATSAETIDEEEDGRGDEDDSHAESDADEPGVPDAVEVEGGSEGEGVEGDEYRGGGGEEFAEVGVEVAEEHADAERQDCSDEGGPGEGGEAGGSEGDHGEEGAGLECHDGVGGGFLRGAVLAGEGHVEAAVGVVDGGDDGEGGDAGPEAGADGLHAEPVAEDEAGGDAEKGFGA